MQRKGSEGESETETKRTLREQWEPPSPSRMLEHGDVLFFEVHVGLPQLVLGQMSCPFRVRRSERIVAIRCRLGLGLPLAAKQDTIQPSEHDERPRRPQRRDTNLTWISQDITEEQNGLMGELLMALSASSVALGLFHQLVSDIFESEDERSTP